MAVPAIMEPVRPSAPTRIKYQKQLDALIDEMAVSLLYWLRATYRRKPPATVGLGQDASPTGVLQAAFDKLQHRWLHRFDEMAPKIADWFGKRAVAYSETAMKADLRRGGFTVRFKPSQAMNDAYDAIIDENVGLIKSIAAQHLTQVRTALMQSVQNGRDLGYLTRELTEHVGVSKRRAARIALDQNNKATAVMARTRALELGITKAKWLHSRGGKTPRPEHLAFDGKVYDLATGHDFGDGEGFVWPGTLINCRCVSGPIVPGFD